MMRLLRSLPLAAALVLLVACDARSGDPDTVAGDASAAAAPSSTADTDVVKANDSNNDLSKIPPPRPDSVLYLISDVDGNGALSYETANGSYINYWYGLQYESLGEQHYTGFAWSTPARYGADEEENYPDPGTKVVLSHASFVATGDPEKPWKWEGSEPYIGEFGGNERGNEVDTSRRHQLWRAPDGDVLLAVPTTYFVSGTTMRTIEILHFHAKLPLGVDDKRWRYLGTLEVGSENDASCDPEVNPRIACTDVTGKLEFVEQPAGAFPVLSVAFPEGSGEKSREYRYDPQTKTYRPT